MLVAQSAHTGLARALEPVHTQFDGDAALAAATNKHATDVETVRLLAARATERAIRRAAGRGYPAQAVAGRPVGPDLV
jgi:L-aminopeptidase/D-esterase-like protein